MDEVNNIGGYFEIELSEGQEYHDKALKFNSGRNALAYFLLKKDIKKIHVPVYICDTLVEAIRKTKTKIQFYNIDISLAPQISKTDIGEKDFLLIVNYFGISEKSIKQSCKKFNNIIIDNCQSFFSSPDAKINAFYSPRKFLGVADGGYLYADDVDNKLLNTDKSVQRYMAQLVRMDGDAQEGYHLYRNTELLLGEAKIKKMSFLTQRILKSIRYDKIWEIRENNFRHLHNAFKDINELPINLNSIHGPLVYPLLLPLKDLSDFLISKKIFVKKYWPEVLKRSNKKSIEYYLSKYLCGLPIDQRYTIKEMDVIINTVKSFLIQKRNKNISPESSNSILNTPV